MRRPLPRALRRAALLVIAATSVVVPMIALAAPADAASAPVASIATTSRTVRAGGDVTVFGRLTASGRPVVGQVVAVQQRTHGTLAWRTVTRTTTSAAGRVAVSRSALLRSKDYRLRYASAVTTAVSAVATVVVPTSITASVASAPTPTAGDPVVLSGRTSAGLAGARVHLQLLVDGAWTSISSSVVAADATYTVRAVATLGGDRQYRTLVKAAAGRAEASSDPQEVTVYAWYRVASAVTASEPPALAAGRQVIAGRPYADSLGALLAQGSSATLRIPLHNRCLALRTTYGATDDSDGGFYGVFRALADDDVAVDVTLDKGSVQTAQVDITGAAVLRLTSTALTGTGDAAWGNPEVLCAGL